MSTSSSSIPASTSAKGSPVVIGEDGTAKNAVKFIRSNAQSLRSKGSGGGNGGGGGQEARTTLKTILDSPFNFKWPSLSESDFTEIVERLCRALSPIGDYRREQESQARKRQQETRTRKRKAETEAKKIEEIAVIESTDDTKLDLDARMKLFNQKKRKQKKPMAVGDSMPAVTATVTFDEQQQQQDMAATMEELKARKDHMNMVLEGVVVGVNNVTKCLEDMVQIRQLRAKGKVVDASSSAFPPLAAVIVCKGDVAPSHLFSHLPSLAYMSGTETLLLGLPKGSEEKVAAALGMPRLVALGVKQDISNAGSEIQSFLTFLKSKVSPPEIPWLPRAVLEPPPSIIKLTAKRGSANTAGTAMQVDSDVPTIQQQSQNPPFAKYMPTKMKTLCVKVGARKWGKNDRRSDNNSGKGNGKGNKDGNNNKNNKNNGDRKGGQKQG
ncbi:RNase P and RNase MRP subunit [Blyttiomyces sp. JEL0837]|nr:RNase P and RNase MRP subunit [Blyttiomyces sp. JEL0837]